MIAAVIVTVIVSLALVALLARGVFLGYPAARVRGAFLGRKEQAIVAACADALFPPGGPIPLSGTEAGLVAYMDTYVRRLGRSQRFLIKLLLWSIEHTPWIFGPRHARFSRISHEERLAVLADMAKSSIYFRRISFLSLRAILTMAYLAHPVVAERVGMVSSVAPFEGERVPAAPGEVYA